MLNNHKKQRISAPLHLIEPQRMMHRILPLILHHRVEEFIEVENFYARKTWFIPFWMMSVSHQKMNR